MNRKVSNKIIGIDLGTTNSCVAFDGEVIQRKGKRTTPSVVFFDEKGEKVVGIAAKKQSVVKPKQVIFEVKRLIGRKFDSKEVQEFCKIAPFKIFEKKDKNGAA